jgi:hypothetical protein
VKHLRIWLLVLLCALLPLRGAMAAAMLCAPDSSGLPSAPMLDLGHGMSPHAHGGHGEGHGHAEADAGRDGAAGHGGHGDPGGPDAAPTLDTCNLCASFCSLTPTPVTLAWAVAPLGPATALFPADGTQVRSFVPEGLERPPRSI